MSRKRTQAEYEKEADDAAKRFKLNPQYKPEKSKDSQTWFKFLEDVLKVNPVSIGRGSDFFEDVRQRIEPENRVAVDNAPIDFWDLPLEKRASIEPESSYIHNRSEYYARREFVKEEYSQYYENFG